jgi:hypothetical protein
VNSTTAVVGTSNRRPVGAIPGRNHGIVRSWVNVATDSSTKRLCPTVRLTVPAVKSAGMVGMNCSA